MRRASGKRRPGVYIPILAPQWSFIEKHCPGARSAWDRDVGLPDHEFTIGVAGKPIRAVAFSKEWHALPESARKKFEYTVADRQWRSIPAA